MKNSNRFLSFLQSFLSPEKVAQAAKNAGYQDTSRQFSVHWLLGFWTLSAVHRWKSYRSGAALTESVGLNSAHYSRISTKAAEVPYLVFKELFHLLVSQKNRRFRRQLAFPKELLLLDSTTVTVGETRLPWAPYHGKKAGIKLHIALRETDHVPEKVEETTGSVHDGPISERLVHPDFIMIMDRAYGKIERLDRFKTRNQSYVVRLRDNVYLHQPRSLRRHPSEDSSVIRDISCQLGTPQNRSQERHRVVVFQDYEGREIRVATDLMEVSGEHIAQMYKERWEIEVFFRWIKQNLNVPSLFGTTENAVYGQLYGALIAYVILKSLFESAKMNVPKHVELSFIRFFRLFLTKQLPVEWRLVMQQGHFSISVFQQKKFT
ncbi:IS4 family transposase [Paenibacillus xylanexedens]|uniref:IS4 family transposase n=1 Tax=Paenibacillus xylanexedens TaxID=528191 RepID=UPI001642BB8E|nr:IS4 family transposase [Paenibacillus xylanexedens]